MKTCVAVLLLLFALALFCPRAAHGGSQKDDPGDRAKVLFRTSDRCVACHNELKTSSGEDVSIGFQWRASIMANSARDPYWQGSVRRESMDHPDGVASVEEECSICHMPITYHTAKSEGQHAQIFSHLPLSADHPGNAEAADGVSCSVCHQIEKERLGTKESFNGQVVFAPPQQKDQRPEYGPFAIDAGHIRIMQSSTAGFIPSEGDHIRDSALCGSCHTLITKALGPGGNKIGNFPEQMPYLEWLHSDYPKTYSCQGCHMPEVKEAVPITAIYGQPRQGLHRHEFLGGNFFMERLLNDHRDELDVKALPQELSIAGDRTAEFLQTQSARVSIRNISTDGNKLFLDVLVENLTGHKLPTAYPSRRAWLHVTVRDSSGKVVFESGALNPDGSVVGNDNDADPLRFEPYYREITSPDQVQIFEPILKDAQGHVTTGLLSTVAYYKDSRILPKGFDKQTADKDIAAVGEAADDPGFIGGSAQTRYTVRMTDLHGPFHVEAELWYQPIGYRWAHNLEAYKAEEPQRFVGYYEAASRNTAIILARAEADH